MRSLARLSLALLFVLALPVCGFTKQDITKSVVPLQTYDYKTFCTAFSINEQEHLYMTAGHCVAYSIENKVPMMIKGGWAVPVMARFGDGNDIAVIHAEYGSPAVKMSSHAPEVGDAISIIGFPYGLAKAIEVHGYLAGKSVPLSDPGMEWPISDVLDITVAGGNSGSPVFNEDGRVVGLLWGGMTSSPHALSIPWEMINRLAGGYYAN